MRLPYGDQLKHPFWQRKRLEVFERAGFRCERCRDDQTTLHAHHKHYVKGRMAWEYDSDELVALCEICHKEVHDEQAQLKALLVLVSPDAMGELLAIIAGVLDADVGDDELGRFAGEVARGLLRTKGWTVYDMMALSDAITKRDAALVTDLRALARRLGPR